MPRRDAQPLLFPRRQRVTILALSVFFLGGGVNLIRAGLAFHQARTLPELPFALSPWLLMGSSLVWGGLFLTLGLVLWRAWRRGRQLTLLFLGLYHLHIWINHLVFDQSEAARQRWPLAALNSILVILGALWLLRGGGPSAKQTTDPHQATVNGSRQ